MFRLFPFFLLSVLVAFAMHAGADSIYGSGPGGDLIGSFDNNLNGRFVSINYDSARATIEIPGATVVLQKSLGTPTLTGPLADFRDVQVHDNLYGWIHIQGHFQIQADAVKEVPRGLSIDSLFLVAPGGFEYSHDGTWLTVAADDTLITKDDSFHNQGPQPGAWALLERQGSDVVMDWLAFHGAPFKTQQLGEEVVMDLVGTLGSDQPDLLVRFEDHGHFEPRSDRFIFRLQTLAAHSVDAAELKLPRGGFSFTTMEKGHNIVNLRLPEGTSGEVSWQQDLIAPAIVDTVASNLDPYSPLAVVPELRTSWSEPVRGELRIGGQVKQTVNPAEQLRFRLTGLQPETAYNYTLDVRDLAGNTATHTGSLTTGPRDGPTAKITVLEITELGNQRQVRFAASLDDGTPASVDQIHIFIDKKTATNAVSVAEDFLVNVPSGAKELRIEVATITGRASEVIMFGSDEEAPMPWWLLPAAIVLARRR